MSGYAHVNEARAVPVVSGDYSRQSSEAEKKTTKCEDVDPGLSRSFMEQVKGSACRRLAVTPEWQAVI
jgi:hypothetical protein